jgi:NAD(P)-dependent dehydrogenase (short-subunit alcohol dehydrogenase family)
VVITGAARGMGAAHARALVREGATVAIADIAADPGERLAAELRQGGGRSSYHEHDVSDPGAWQKLVAAVEQIHGPIGVLVNNAGVQVRSVGIEADDEEWTRVTAINQHGVFLGMRAVIPGMVRRGGGSIVNVASTAALVGMPGSIPYQASKAAVLGLTRGAAVSYGRDNIRVNAICPGLVVTGMTETASADAVEAMKAQIPLRRDGQPEEISAAVVFLASDESSYITGVALPIDGGFVAV